MPRVSYVNGLYVPHAEAAVHIEDRGYQFADAVYEVMAVAAGRARHVEQHLDRLGRSLAAVEIGWPVPRRVLPLIVAEVVRRNLVGDGIVYLQIGRGVAKRNHLFPADAVPSLVVTARRQSGPSAATVERGVTVVTRPDQRWGRVDIKTIGLLANVLARQSAKQSGAYETWLVDANGQVTEGAATNAFIVAADGTLLAQPAGPTILGGVTRANVLELARRNGIAVAERAFTADEAKAAAEAFLSGTTVMVLPVIAIDGAAIGDGRPGPVTRRLRTLYQELRNS